MSNLNNVIIVNNINKRFKIGTNGKEISILNDISFSVNKGEFVSIVGPSGSGKTTLLYAISGLSEPSSGEVRLVGINPYDLKPRKAAVFRRQQVGFIFQQYNLIDSLPVYENIILQERLSHKKSSEKQVQKLLDSMNFSPDIYSEVNNLSGGEKQKVAIARAIMANTAVLFADEPTGALDSISRESIFKQLKQFVRDGKSVVMVTHDLELAAQTDRALVLLDGKISSELKKPTLSEILKAFEGDGHK